MPDNDLDSYLDPASRRRNYDDLIQKHAQRTGLDPDLIKAVVDQESRGNPRAVSPKGARGVMQLIPATAQRFGVTDPYDPEQSIRGGTDYLKFLNDRYKGNRDLVLAGYNAGEGAVDKYGGIPPYRETRNYVRSINARLGQSQKPGDLDRYLDPQSSEQTPPASNPSETATKTTPAVSPVNPPAPSAPIRPKRGSSIFGRPEVRQAVAAQQAQQARAGVTVDAGPGASVELDPRTMRPLTETMGSSNIGELKRADEPEVRRIQRLQREEAARAAGPPTLDYMGTIGGRGQSARVAQVAAQRASDERAVELKAQQEQPELDRLTEQYRQQIRDAARLIPALGPDQWFQEALHKGEAGLLEAGAGIVRAAKYNPLATGAEETADRMRLHAEAMQRAAIEEGADRNVVSRILQDATAGLISTAPELAAMSAGAPPIATFGAGGGLRAYGRGGNVQEVAKETAKGATTGAAFELPVPQAITSVPLRAATKGALVGGTTGGIELASGASPKDAASAAITNALFGAYGELKHGVTPKRVEEVAASVPESLRDDPQVRELIDKARADVRQAIGERYGEVQSQTQPPVATERTQVESVPDTAANMGGVLERPNTRSETGVREGVSSEPRRFYHRDFGEVTESPNQKQVGKGRVRVTAEDGSEHVVKRPTGTGAGNQRAVPVREQPAEQPLEQYLEPAAKQTAPTVSSRPDGGFQVNTEQGNLIVRPIVDEQGKPTGDFETFDVFVQPEARRQGVATRLYAEAQQEAQRRGGKLFSSTEQTAEGEALNGGLQQKARTVARQEIPSVGEAGGVNSASLPASSEPRGSSGGLAREASSTTAIKNASMEADRAARDLPELAQAEPRKATEVHQRAVDANARDPRSVDRLVDQALKTNKNYTDVETAQVRLRAQEIKNREAELLREIEKTDNPVSIREKRLELDSLADEFDRLSQATKKAGTEWGRAGVARQQAIDQDYSLVAMKARLKVAKGGPLSEAEKAKVEDLSKRLKKAEADLNEANEKLAQRDFQKAVDRMARKERRTQTKQSLDEEFAQLKQQFAQARVETRGVQASGLAGLDPEGRLTKLIGQMAKNRIKAGVTDAAQLVDDIHAAISEHLQDVSKRDIRDAISGYGQQSQPREQAAETQRLNEIRRELKQLSEREDVAAGKRLNAADKRRQTQLRQQEAEFTRRLNQKDFTKKQRIPPVYNRETAELQRRVDEVKAQYNKELYKAQRGRAGLAIDTAISAANIPKTLLSMGDVSALLRQGGVGFYQHPKLSTQAARDMFHAFTAHGFRNVEQAIKSHPDFELAKRSGVEFTGIDKPDAHLTHREEGYLGSDVIDTLAKGKLNPLRIVKGVKDVSERTFVSFLDSQRMRIFGEQAGRLRDMKLTPDQFNAALKSQAGYVNAITGRGSLGRYNNAAPLLNTVFFSPRLVASRVQLMNKMFNPVAWARMPEGARRLQLEDNAKFAAGALATLALARAAGAQVGLDPDDADFLKIRVGNTTYDTLTGLQQPLRYFINMGRALVGGETYPGKSVKEMSDPFEAGSFTRSKLSPVAGAAIDLATGSDFMGRKATAGSVASNLLAPLPSKDVFEAVKQDGAIRGTVEALPSFLGVGVQAYPHSPEPATTQADKLARKFIRAKMPDEARTQQEIDVDTKKADLRARARRGEDVRGELQALGANITDRQAKGILSARNQTRLQEDVNRLGIKDALLVYSVANSQQRAELKSLMEKKAALISALPPDEQQAAQRKLRDYGITGGRIRISRPSRESRMTR